MQPYTSEFGPPNSNIVIETTATIPGPTHLDLRIKGDNKAKGMEKNMEVNHNDSGQ